MNNWLPPLKKTKIIWKRKIKTKPDFIFQAIFLKLTLIEISSLNQFINTKMMKNSQINFFFYPYYFQEICFLFLT